MLNNDITPAITVLMGIKRQDLASSPYLIKHLPL